MLNSFDQLVGPKLLMQCCLIPFYDHGASYALLLISVLIQIQGHISKGLNGNGSGHDSDGTYMSSLSGSGSGGRGGGSVVVVGRVGGGVGSISDLV